jgi:hypothetical protein
LVGGPVGLDDDLFGCLPVDRLGGDAKEHADPWFLPIMLDRGLRARLPALSARISPNAVSEQTAVDASAPFSPYI